MALERLLKGFADFRLGYYREHLDLFEKLATEGQSPKILIIGCGGIMKPEDVVEYLLAGASAVEIGYLNFRNPTGMIAIIAIGAAAYFAARWVFND